MKAQIPDNLRKAAYLFLVIICVSTVYFISAKHKNKDSRAAKDEVLIQDAGELNQQFDKSIAQIKKIGVITPLNDSFGGADGLSDVALSGIAWDEKLPLAFVNQSVMGVGDKVNGSEIVEIKKQSITLKSREGKEVVVKLW